MKRELVYISHPYGGKEENKREIEGIIRVLMKENPKAVYVSPVHLYGWLYDEMGYMDGLSLCLNLLGRADRMLVYGDCDTSRGCLAEIEYSRQHNIPYEIRDGARKGEKLIKSGKSVFQIRRSCVLERSL